MQRWCWVIFSCLLLVLLSRAIAEEHDDDVSNEEGGSFGGAADEHAALRVLSLRPVSETVTSKDVKTAISRGWWAAAQVLIRRAHDQGIDISSTVRSSVSGVRKSADELVRMLEKSEDVKIVSPAFQWAQSNEAIFLQVKFAYRWSSPGAIAVERENITVQSCCLYFSGLGTHSHAGNLYELELEFFDAVDPEATEWSFGSVGKLTVTLQKKNPSTWPRLTSSVKGKANMHVWWEMKERFEMETEERRKNETKKKEAGGAKGSGDTDNNNQANVVEDSAEVERSVMSDEEKEPEVAAENKINGENLKETRRNDEL